MPRLLPDVWNTPFPGLKKCQQTGSRVLVAGDDGKEKETGRERAGDRRGGDDGEGEGRRVNSGSRKG